MSRPLCHCQIPCNGASVRMDSNLCRRVFKRCCGLSRHGMYRHDRFVISSDVGLLPISRRALPNGMLIAIASRFFVYLTYMYAHGTCVL
jgi:hypothetical protein